MHEWSQEILRRLASLKLPPAREAEIVEEVGQHLEDRYQELVADGATEEEARRVALEELSDEDLLARGLRRVEQEATQEPSVPGGGGRSNSLAGIWQDIRYGLRMLRKNPGFTTMAVLTLALAIGPNTAIFSVLNAVVLRPLPYQDPQRLVLVKEKLPELTGEPLNVPAPDVLEFQRQAKLFTNVAGFQPVHYELSGGGQPERIAATRASPSLFPLLGVVPVLGRTFTNEEDHPGSLVTVISYRTWQSRFAGRADVLGRTVLLDRKPYTVVGVTPQGFEFPLDSEPLQPASLWVPMALTHDELSDFGDNFD